MSGSTTASPATASVLRPRTRRLISGLDEGDEVAFDPSTAPSISIASPLPSALELGQRSASPIPPTHLPRPTSNYDRRLLNTGSNSLADRGTGVRSLGQDSGTSLERLWGTSWSAVQNIASDLLGSSAQNGPPLAKGKVPRQRRDLQRSSKDRTLANVPPMSWGPQTATNTTTIKDVGVGTREEAEAAFRAKKRLDLLTGQGSTFTDTMGRYKRRTSDDLTAAASVHDIGDALVYVHNVQKGDTLAGITLKYNCSAIAVQKANRLWPNDPIQTRTHILLPVDTCGVKGRLLSGPEEVDLLGDENAPIPAGGNVVQPLTTLALGGDMASTRQRSDSSVTRATTERSSSKARSSTATEIVWQHDSWVLLPGSTKPTEIARLSRQVLGYFPPARRKSQTFSDHDSPRVSHERPRTVVGETLNSKSSHSPAPRSASAHVRHHSAAVNGYFGSYLSGPGGVGTMDSAVRAPGPAPDSLNALFAKHLPDVAPPRNQHALYQPDLPLFADDMTPTASGLTTPGAGVNKNLEHMGGAIESWMRRVASKAKDAMDSPDRQRAARASVGAPGRGVGGTGDLIEMTDEFELGGDEEDDIQYYDDTGRGRPALSLLDQGGSGGTSASFGLQDGGARHRDVGKSKKS